MRLIKFYIILSVALVFGACYDDKSTEATNPISEITIVRIDSVYDIYRNDTLIIKPLITQSNTPKPLKYKWEMDLNEISTDDSLFFIGKSLGKFNCRLIVENEDGKSFFPFTLYVNSPYEEGITILSNDPDGKSMLSFMQNGSTGFVSGDCFAVNNPDIPFAAYAADMAQSGGSLILACQGGGESGDVPTLYYLNEKTFIVENMVEVPEFDDFKPTRLGLTSTSYSTTSFPILCENGKVYDFSTTECVVSKPRKFKSTYEQVCYVNDVQYFDILLWDKDNQGLCNIYNGYGPYYCSETYHLDLESPDFVDLNYYSGRDLVALVQIQMTPAQKTNAGNRQECLIVTKKGAKARLDLLPSCFWVYDNIENISKLDLTQNGTVALSKVPFDVSTPSVANKTYETMLFAKGNKIYRWYYPDKLSKISTETELLSVGNENCIITSLTISADHKKTYVAFYDPAKEGLNGSIWTFDTDKGTILDKYDNICYKPVKVIYKKR